MRDLLLLAAMCALSGCSSGNALDEQAGPASRPPLDTILQKAISARPDWNSAFDPETSLVESGLVGSLPSPCTLFGDAKRVLADKKTSDEEKNLTVFLMFELPLGSYFEWTHVAYESYSRGTLASRFLAAVVAPPVEVRSDYYLAYDHQAAQKLFSMLRNDATLVEVRVPNPESALPEYAAAFLQGRIKQQVMGIAPPFGITLREPRFESCPDAPTITPKSGRIAG